MPDTVPLAEHVTLGRIALEALRLRAAYFEHKRRQPHVPNDPLFQACRAAERRLKSAALDAVNRERVCLPGMEKGGEPAAG